jgi:hypothetical protein
MKLPSEAGRADGWRLLCLGLLFVIHLPTPKVWAQPAEENLNALLRRMDKLWVERDKSEALHDLVTLGLLALTIPGDDYDAMWRTARAQFWLAHTQPNRLVKKALAAKAAVLAERAMALRPDRVEGYYVSAVAVGEYATTIGVMKALTEGVAAKIEGAALKAYEVDRDFDSGAPMIVLGRYYYSLPWPKRDLERSRRFLEELRMRHPDSRIGRWYLAETYHATGENEKARAEIDFVLQRSSKGLASGTDDPTDPAREALQHWFGTG